MYQVQSPQNLFIPHTALFALLTSGTSSTRPGISKGRQKQLLSSEAATLLTRHMLGSPSEAAGAPEGQEPPAGQLPAALPLVRSFKSDVLLHCRAEATDVANAVLDGVDAMLMGAETLRGHYPVETVQTVLAICRQAEYAFDHESHFDRMMARAMQVSP